jgi:hypothetical protein
VRKLYIPGARYSGFMVSQKGLKHFTDRVKGIVGQHENTIHTKYKTEDISAARLIADGKGKLYSEEKIRRAASRRIGACGGFAFTEIFDLTGEEAKQEDINKIRRKQYTIAINALHAIENSTLDLVHFGTNEQLLEAIQRLEAYDPIKMI